MPRATRMQNNTIKACVFDAYGSLFDVHSAVADYGIHAVWGNRAGARREYSWVREIVEVLDLKAFGSIIAPLVKA